MADDPPIARLKGLCVKHPIITLNVLILLVGMGVSWGILTAEISALRADVEDFKHDQIEWNREERQVDETHRLRLQHLEDRLYEAVIKGKQPG